MFLSSRETYKDLDKKIEIHTRQKLACCHDSVSIFTPIASCSQEKRGKEIFPPKPITPKLEKRIITDYCEELKAENILEEGCAVCSRLALTSDMQTLS
ncbi:hypothetical protein DENSPDRAFT_788164, partial [Dentipellis sp. KUC8613]